MTVPPFPAAVLLAASVCTASAWLPAAPAAEGQAPPDRLRSALTFHASFDRGADADHGAGDRRLHWAPSFRQRDEASPGLPPDGDAVTLAAGGRFGSALRFARPKAPLVFYRAAGNMRYAPADWSGTVSFWLSADPAGELAPGFCDPVQITPRAWNDAAFFVEFEKRPGSIPFRLGVYADLSVWNPANRKIADIPSAERPLVTVEDPPFGRGRWTHVAFTFSRFNTGRPDGVARLYLDGVPRGDLTGRQQTFTWDPERSAIALGLNYVGLLDELSIFDRALADEDVLALQRLEGGVTRLLDRPR